jgi:hypothetical protein
MICKSPGQVVSIEEDISKDFSLNRITAAKYLNSKTATLLLRVIASF